MTELNPAQLLVAEGLLDLRGFTPKVTPEQIAELTRRFKEQLQSSVDALDQAGQTLWVNKNTIATVLGCETRWRDGDNFAWTVANAVGTITHRAAELMLVGRHAGPPSDAVDGAIRLLVDENQSFGEFYDAADGAQHAALRAGAIGHVTSLVDGFPPLPRRVLPRTEQTFSHAMSGRTIELRARPDLALGRPSGPDARSLLIDLKTGRPHQSHADDLRFYALVFTLRWGAAPWRVASYYAADGTWVAEDVDIDVLDAAVRRVADAVRKITEMNVSNRPPGLTPGPMCRWCALSETCEGAKAFEEALADENDDLGFGDDDLF
ncbi:MAG: PD-(D/E)XK nuclease family protein [Acidimicrobiales bacterium]|nr:PD-(D/E)XK nuclease family protein [Acidimicrobiales bacterium]